MLAGKQRGMIITPNGPPVLFQKKERGNLVTLKLILRSIVGRITASQNVHVLILEAVNMRLRGKGNEGC